MRKLNSSKAHTHMHMHSISTKLAAARCPTLAARCLFTRLRWSNLRRVAATRVDAALVNSLIGVGCGFASLKRVRLRSHVAVQRSLHSASRAV